MSNEMNDLIADERRDQNAVYLATEKSVADDLARIIAGLADALEAATRERAAAPDAATERVTENSVRHVKRLTTELQNKREALNDQRREYRALLSKRDRTIDGLRAERDAALAAIERVRAIHERDMVLRDYCSECSDFGSDQFPPGQMVEWPCPTVAALDGAPEPEWEHALFMIESDGSLAITAWKPDEFEYARKGWPDVGFIERRRIKAPWLPVEGEKP